ncbi:MAG: guanitoxin biosynthesis heme-dependent pre-guanitoxin N-hydroxylase GntA [Pseudomonadota bacterium]|nr:guanitoxin biosynthesis heme-dependent pre-guanitoxin N-hydroxylase GntA [Pseudomonadota bacterium]
MKEINNEIRAFILQKNYPCVAAIQSVVRKDYLVGEYGRFGTLNNWQELRGDLLNFLELQSSTQSRYLSFWAVFTDTNQRPDSETQFEEKFWRELSLLSSEEDRPFDWGKNSSVEPKDPLFCLSLNGEKLFVVGLHPQSSRLARRFSRPAMVFNAFSQFEKFENEGTYAAMVKTIRQRELMFQGSVNPMVLAHGDTWESIQYSGRENPESWKCPFQFIKQENKSP